MISNNGMYFGSAFQFPDGQWRIRIHQPVGVNDGPYPFPPAGFDTRSACERWWASTGDPLTCRVCGRVFFAARSDAEFCTAACRAKYNRHAQGASEHKYTGAYHQRAADDRAHAQHADTFEYQCEWCGKTCTARAEAKRSKKRTARYCNDNGGRCRQAAYRAAQKKESERPKSDREDTHETHHSGPRTHAAPPPRPNYRASTEPRHSGPWRSDSECVAFLASVYRWNHSGTQAAWASANDRRAALAWAKRYISANHPDRTGKAADTVYKTVSDCYSYLRKQA